MGRVVLSWGVSAPLSAKTTSLHGAVVIKILCGVRERNIGSNEKNV